MPGGRGSNGLGLPTRRLSSDPQGVAWETFHTLDSIPVYDTDVRTTERVNEKAACCVPPQTVKIEATQSNVCCK